MSGTHRRPSLKTMFLPLIRCIASLCARSSDRSSSTDKLRVKSGFSPTETSFRWKEFLGPAHSQRTEHAPAAASNEATMMSLGRRITTRLRQAGAMVSNWQQTRNPGLACSLLVSPGCFLQIQVSRHLFCLAGLGSPGVAQAIPFIAFAGGRSTRSSWSAGSLQSDHPRVSVWRALRSRHPLARSRSPAPGL